MTLLDSFTRGGAEVSPYLLTNHTGEGSAYTLIAGDNQAQLFSLTATCIGTDPNTNSVYLSNAVVPVNHRASITFTTPASFSTNLVASVGVLTRITGAYGYCAVILLYSGAIYYQLLKLANGNLTDMLGGSGLYPISTLAANTQYILSLDSFVSTHSVILQRVSDSQYLTNALTFTSSTEVAFTSVNDTQFQGAAIGLKFGDTGGIGAFKYNAFNTYNASTPNNITLPFAIGTLSQNSVNSNNISFNNTGATGGTAPYSYQWYRSLNSGFTPDNNSLLNGQTNSTLTDSTTDSNKLYFYKLITKDANNNSITSAQIAGIKLNNNDTIKILVIGDSISSTLYQATNKTQLRLKEVFKNKEVLIYNAAIPGSNSSQWLSGSTYLTSAKTNAVNTFGIPSDNNRVWVTIMLGVNDARLSTPNNPYVYRSNLSNIISDLLNSGYKVILHAPPCISIPQAANGVGNNTLDTESGMSILLSYPAQLDLLCDGVNVFKGDRLATNYFATHLNEFITTDIINGVPSLVHPNSLGEDSYATFWSYAITRIINDKSGLTSPTNSLLN